MAYQVVLLKQANEDLIGLDAKVRVRIVEKLRWLADNCKDLIHRRLSNMPDDLAGLCRLRLGDWRVLYWVDEDKRQVVVYRVGHRSTIYGILR